VRPPGAGQYNQIENAPAFSTQKFPVLSKRNPPRKIPKIFLKFFQKTY